MGNLEFCVTFLIVYITVAGGERTENFAIRFTSTFRTFPPGCDNWGMCVVSNGGPMDPDVERHFLHVPRTVIIKRDNSGHDIGGYLEVAHQVHNYDALLCLGQSCYFYRPGWLARIAEVWQKHGPGLYGFYASNIVRKHLNSTAFCVAPDLLRGWNQKVQTKEHRYDFEHGKYPFWKQVEALGRPVRLVMWDHDLAPSQWRTTENEFWRASQEQCLIWCSHTDRFQNATKATKTRWQNNADHGLRVVA